MTVNASFNVRVTLRLGLSLG